MLKNIGKWKIETIRSIIQCCTLHIMSSGETKETTLSKKIELLVQEKWNRENKLQNIIANVPIDAIKLVISGYSSFCNNGGKESELDEISWILLDLFEWRWQKDIAEVFPCWNFTYGNEGHYKIHPVIWINYKEIAERTLRQPTIKTYYNLPVDVTKLTYWHIFGPESDEHLWHITNFMPDIAVDLVAQTQQRIMNWEYIKHAIRIYISRIHITTTPFEIPDSESIESDVYNMWHFGNDNASDEELFKLQIDDTAPQWLRHLSIFIPEDSINMLNIGIIGKRYWIVDKLWSVLTDSERDQVINVHQMLQTRWTDHSLRANSVIQSWMYEILHEAFYNCFEYEAPDLSEIDRVAAETLIDSDITLPKYPPDFIFNR